MNTRVVLSVMLALMMVVGSAVEASAKGGPHCRPRVVVRYGGPRYCAPAPVVVYRRPIYRRPMMRHRYYANNHYQHNHYGNGYHHGYSNGNAYGHYHRR